MHFIKGERVNFIFFLFCVLENTNELKKKKKKLQARSCPLSKILLKISAEREAIGTSPAL